MKLELSAIPGLRVTIMGLGLHGGGTASTLFFARHGAQVTVTDLRSEVQLAPSLEQLSGISFRSVLGRHEESDFRGADIVIKNPAVAASSPLLKLARQVESDISVFLSLCKNPLLAVTGTKGKSTTTSAVYETLKTFDPEARIGGNITVSPLTFLDELAGGSPGAPVVLELSSWQLADLAGKGVLKPKVAAITNIMPDHLNRYASMEAYVDDKRVIYAEQESTAFTVCNYDDPYGRSFASETPARTRFFSRTGLPEGVDGAWIDGGGGRGLYRDGAIRAQILPEQLALPGEHNRKNLLAASLMLVLYGLPSGRVAERIASFRGIPHRLELLSDSRGILVYNDSAATIPEATAAALDSFKVPVILIAGGTDKKLDFSVLRSSERLPRLAFLLSGSATGKLQSVLDERGVESRGPFESLEAAVAAAVDAAVPGEVILFSPGCTSFEMFANEFDRGNRFREIVKQTL